MPQAAQVQVSLATPAQVPALAEKPTARANLPSAEEGGTGK